MQKTFSLDHTVMTAPGEIQGHGVMRQSSNPAAIFFCLFLETSADG
jgi:hypothetical protein